MLPKTSSIYEILQFLEYSDPVYNINQCILLNFSKFHSLKPPQKEAIEIMVDFIQFILWNFSKFHSLNPPQKEVIERMVDLVQFWFIQKTELVQNALLCSIFNIRF